MLNFRIFAFFVISTLSVSGFSTKITDETDAVHLPSGTQLQLKADAPGLPDPISILAGDESILLSYVTKDSDSDGVYDFNDWCTKTPAGAKVWTGEDVDDIKVKWIHVGCSGASEEQWLYDPKTRQGKIGGHETLCKLELEPAKEERELSLKHIFTVEGTTYEGGFREPKLKIFAKTSGGTELVFKILHAERAQQARVERVTFPDPYFHNIRVADLKTFFDIKIPAPTPIP